MSFRARIALATAAAVAIAVVAASGVVYLVVKDELYSSVDASLRSSMQVIQHAPPDTNLADGPPQPGVFGGYPQAVRQDGVTFVRGGNTLTLPVDEHVLRVARGADDTFLANADVGGNHVRMITFPWQPGLAVQIARPLDETDRSLDQIKILLFFIAAGGILVAAGLGLAVSSTALTPVRRLTQATETIAETRDLSERIANAGKDELGRLATSFNAMLAALEESDRARTQLVADASHELRTPLTSLRTNIEVLLGDRPLPPGERDRLLRDVIDQLGEMTTLISELIELARGERHQVEPEDVRLDLVTAGAVERTKRNRPGVEFTTDLQESMVHGVPETLDRAVGNLLDNAAKWSPPDGEVEVSVRGGEVTVRDHGPGIDEDDLPYVFDRFYRASSARKLPGSGLGLAIVRQVAEAHGGTVVAERADGGGTVMRFRLNGASENNS
ncbi:MAG TPA: HAMP domain-containing sensor histidine kinase [Gaiellaceae bacterium]|jgi:two-component system sensor histidine kinase MprB